MLEQQLSQELTPMLKQLLKILLLLNLSLRNMVGKNSVIIFHGHMLKALSYNQELISTASTALVNSVKRMRQWNIISLTGPTVPREV